MAPQLNTHVSAETVRRARYLRNVYGYSLRDLFTLGVQHIYDQVRENEEKEHNIYRNMYNWLTESSENESKEADMYLDEYGFDTRLLALADAIHNAVCGCADKTCTIEADVYDWLASTGGNDDVAATPLDDLIADWREYTAAPEDDA